MPAPGPPGPPPPPPPRPVPAAPPAPPAEGRVDHVAPDACPGSPDGEDPHRDRPGTAWLAGREAVRPAGAHDADDLVVEDPRRHPGRRVHPDGEEPRHVRDRVLRDEGGRRAGEGSVRLDPDQGPVHRVPRDHRRTADAVDPDEARAQDRVVRDPAARAAEKEAEGRRANEIERDCRRTRLRPDGDLGPIEDGPRDGSPGGRVELDAAPGDRADRQVREELNLAAWSAVRREETFDVESPRRVEPDGR